jgi:hypothetical protein
MKASITRNQATFGKIKVQNKLLFTSKIEFVFTHIKAIHKKVNIKKIYDAYIFLDEVDTYELLPIKELANKFL